MDSERECRSQFDSDTVDVVDRGCGCCSLALTLSAPYSVFSTLNLSLPLPPSSVADHHLQPPVHKSRTDTGLSPPDNQWRSRLRVLSELQRLPFQPHRNERLHLRRQLFGTIFDSPTDGSILFHPSISVPSYPVQPASRRHPLAGLSEVGGAGYPCRH